jgi:hypothetical protein
MGFVLLFLYWNILYFCRVENTYNDEYFYG